MLISVDELVRSLSQFDFDQSKTYLSSLIIPGQAVVGTDTEEDLELKSLPTIPADEKIVKDHIGYFETSFCNEFILHNSSFTQVQQELEGLEEVIEPQPVLQLD